MRYSVFISYNHKDRRWASWLHRELERYRLPKTLVGRPAPWGALDRRLPPVFQDREELAASINLADSVREALAESSSLIVICSSNGAASRWVNEEVRSFAALGRAQHIQCLMVPEADGSSGTDSFPPALLEIGHEPLAADARKSGDGPRNAFLKLVAGVVGVRYDELRQRELARRQRRLLTLAAAATVGFVIMTGLAAFALVSRAQAVRERDIARQKTVTAERTTDFVKGLFAVADPQEALGEQVTVVSALDKGARQLAGTLSDEPDVKAELTSTLSEVYMGLGSFRRADALIRQSFALPVTRNETRARQLATFGASQALQGEYDRAADIYGKALAQIKEPSALTDTGLYSRILIGRAEALVRSERFDQARALIARALSWDRTHEGGRSPSVARDLEALGYTEQSAGDLASSTREYRSALGLRVASQGRLHPKVSEDLHQLGANAYLGNDPDGAVNYWRQSLALDERVLGPDHPDLALTLGNLSRVMIEQRRFREAIPLLTRSMNIYLAQREDTHDDLAFIFANLALAKRGIGQDREAEPLFRRGLAAAEVHQNRLIAPILTDLADLLCAQRRFDEAAQALTRAAPIMAKTYPDDPWRLAWVENTRGACLLAQGKEGGAQALRASAPAVLKRWKPGTMYGAEVERRLRSVNRSKT